MKNKLFFEECLILLPSLEGQIAILEKELNELVKEIEDHLNQTSEDYSECSSETKDKIKQAYKQAYKLEETVKNMQNFRYKLESYILRERLKYLCNRITQKDEKKTRLLDKILNWDTYKNKQVLKKLKSKLKKILKRTEWYSDKVIEEITFSTNQLYSLTHCAWTHNLLSNEDIERITQKSMTDLEYLNIVYKISEKLLPWVKNDLLKITGTTVIEITYIKYLREAYPNLKKYVEITVKLKNPLSYNDTTELDVDEIK